MQEAKYVLRIAPLEKRFRDVMERVNVVERKKTMGIPQAGISTKDFDRNLKCNQFSAVRL